MLGPGVAWYLGVAAFLFGIGALGVLVRRNPLIVLLSLEIMLNGANLALIAFSRHFGNGDGQIFALAVLYLLLSAEFVAAAQVLVYAGAVMVMFLFVIAYLGGQADAPWAGGPSWQALGAVAASSALLVEVIVVIGLKTGGRLSHEAKIGSSFGTPAEIGRLFLTDHLLAFEITSIALLVAAVGGVILGSHSRETSVPE